VLGLAHNTPVSYGPCQFPTLGFVVEKFKQTLEFNSSKYWTVTLSITVEDDEKTEEDDEQDPDVDMAD
jgi:DNA topoisomerase III